MEKKRVFSKSLLLLAITSIMLFAMSITSMAATNVSNIRQTSADNDSVKIEFVGTDGAYGYYIYYSSTNGASWTRVDSSTSKYPDTYDGSYTLNNLSSGTTYQIKVVPVYHPNYNIWQTNESQAAIVQVTTAPSDVTNLKQTKATASSVTLQWDKVYGATSYQVYTGTSSSISNQTLLGTAKKNSITVKAPAGSEKSYYVYPIRTISTGYKALYENARAMISAKAAPGKAENLANADKGYLIWKTTDSNTVKVYWDDNSNREYLPDGYRIRIYSVDGKKLLKTYNVGKYDSYKEFNLKAVKNKGFKVEATGYVVVNNKKCYGKSTGKKTVIPQAKIKLEQRSKTSMRVSWTKVKNATSYTIYACKNENVSKKNQKWYKVAKVGKKTTSYTVKKLKTGKYAGFYVIPTVKIGKKSYKADATWYTYTYMSKYY